MHSRKHSLGLIVSFLLVGCQPKAHAHFESLSTEQAFPFAAGSVDVRLGVSTFSTNLNTDGVSQNSQNTQVSEGSPYLNFASKTYQGSNTLKSSYLRSVKILKRNLSDTSTVSEINTSRRHKIKNLVRFMPFMLRKVEDMEQVVYGNRFKRDESAKMNKILNKSSKVSSKLSIPTENAESILTTTHETDVESFNDVDGNRKQQRTFSFLTNLFPNMAVNNSRGNCVYPCTLEAYQNNLCCPKVQEDSNVCNTCQPRPAVAYIPNFLPQIHPNRQYFPNYPQWPYNYFTNSFMYAHNQGVPCCSVCMQYSFYGPPPCLWQGSQFNTRNPYMSK